MAACHLSPSMMQSISWVTSDFILLCFVLAPEICGCCCSNGIAVLWLFLCIYFDLAALKAHKTNSPFFIEFSVINAFVYLIPTILVLFKTYPRS
jgi:hypothetical protein